MTKWNLNEKPNNWLRTDFIFSGFFPHWEFPGVKENLWQSATPTPHYLLKHLIWVHGPSAAHAAKVSTPPFVPSVLPLLPSSPVPKMLLPFPGTPRWHRTAAALNPCAQPSPAHPSATPPCKAPAAPHPAGGPPLFHLFDGSNYSNFSDNKEHLYQKHQIPITKSCLFINHCNR